jgi:NAD(P)-dependent dehydrogenase (short-subunit alcohol dehydrogenase family)
VAAGRRTGDDPLDFAGKVVLVTGGTRGVGRGIAQAYLDAGAEVVVCGRTEPTDESLPRSGEHAASFLPADVRVPEEAAEVVRLARDRHGRLDVLVNNAGGSPEAAAADASPRLSTAVVSLNLLSPLHCAQAAYGVMRGQEAGGSIVNIASVSGTRPSPGTAAYGAAKAGLINLTRTLAVEWAPEVRVNCVVVGLLATEASLDHYGGEAALAAVADTVPMRRLATPADVAGVCLFLASPLAAYVTGSAIDVHGGGERPAFHAALPGRRKAP